MSNDPEDTLLNASKPWTRLVLCTAYACLAIGPALAAPPKPPKSPVTVWLHSRLGEDYSGTLNVKSLAVLVDGKRRDIPLTELLSVRTAQAASENEARTITEALASLSGKTHTETEKAEAALTDIGLPALTPVLQAYKDTDVHEPNVLYRLYARLVDGYADSLDRTLDLIRLSDGEDLRGKLLLDSLTVTTADGKVHSVKPEDVRSLAIRRPEIVKTFDLHSLYHCTQIEFLDTGVALTPASTLEENAKGFVRLSFDIDGWASDPDGLKVPGPHYTTNLVDGFPFGAVVGRIGVAGSRWFAGHRCEKTNTGAGRLYFAVNDNGHWQNNLGSYKVTLRVTNAYGLGDPR